MPKYRITSPDGQTYEITTPDGVEPSHEELVSAVAGQHKPEDPYAKMSLDQIKAQYHGAQLTGGKPELLSKLADAYVSKEQSDRSKAGGITGIANAADNFVRDAARGIPIIGGGLDEASAALNTLGGGNYQENLDYQRARDRFNDKQFGGLSTGTQIAGGIAGTVGTLGALGVGGVAGGAANATRLMPTVTQALRAGAVGSGVGAADAFTRAEGDNRAGSAAIGGVAGGVLGAATPYVAGAVGTGAKRVMNYLTSDAALQRLGISRQAANVLIRQLSTDDTLTQTGAQRIQEAGPQSMLADAGQSATNLLDTALQRSGPGSTAARQAIEQRATQANQWLTQSLDQTFGTAPVGVETRQAAIRNGTAAARGNAYDAAYDQPIDFNTPAGQQLAQDIQRLQASAPWAIEEANSEIAMRGEQPTMVRILDRATRALNSAATRGERGGALGGNTPLGAAAGGLAQDIRASLRQAVPEYGTALDTAADPIRRVQATEFGATILNPKVTRERVTEELAGMTGPERRSAMNGMRDSIDEVVANVKGMASDPNIDARQLREVLKALSSPAARHKVEALVGQNQARAFYGQLGRFARAAELRASVATNSRTFGRSAVDAQVKAQTEPGVIGMALEGNVPGAIKKVIQTFTRMTPERRLAAEDRIYGEIASALTTVRGTAAETQLNRLRAAIQARSGNFAGARAIGAAAGRGFAGSGAGGAVAVQQPSRD